MGVWFQYWLSFVSVNVMLNAIAVLCYMWQYCVMLILLKCEHVYNIDIACPSVNDTEMSPNLIVHYYCVCAVYVCVCSCVCVCVCVCVFVSVCVCMCMYASVYVIVCVPVHV